MWRAVLGCNTRKARTRPPQDPQSMTELDVAPSPSGLAPLQHAGKAGFLTSARKRPKDGDDLSSPLKRTRRTQAPAAGAAAAPPAAASTPDDRLDQDQSDQENVCVQAPAGAGASPSSQPSGDEAPTPGTGGNIFSPFYHIFTHKGLHPTLPSASDQTQLATDRTSPLCLSATATSVQSADSCDADQVCDSPSSACISLSQAPGQPADESDEDDDDFFDFDPYLFIKRLPPLHHVVPRHRSTLLPRQTRACKKKTLVLDLDETLVHSSLQAVADPDFSFSVMFNEQDHVVYVRQRPHMAGFLERVAQLFEVVVFTASQKVYAEKLLNILDPRRKLIRHRIYRDSCVFVDGNYLKDLSCLGRDLGNVLIVDNSPQAFGFQIDNGVPIESWYEDTQDSELSKLLPFLEGLVACDDVRPRIRERFGLQQRVAQAQEPLPPMPMPTL